MVPSPGFVGEYLYTVDTKGRLALPAKFREVLGPRFIIARGLDKCLFVYPGQEWELILDKIKDMPLNQKDSRAYARYFLSGATEAEPDKQGRILVPAHLRDYAELNKEVYVLGVGTRLEVWSKDLWDGMKASIQESFSEIAESIGGL